MQIIRSEIKQTAISENFIVQIKGYPGLRKPASLKQDHFNINTFFVFIAQKLSPYIAKIH